MKAAGWQRLDVWISPELLQRIREAARAARDPRMARAALNLSAWVRSALAFAAGEDLATAAAVDGGAAGSDQGEGDELGRDQAALNDAGFYEELADAAAGVGPAPEWWVAHSREKGVEL